MSGNPTRRRCTRSLDIPRRPSSAEEGLCDGGSVLDPSEYDDVLVLIAHPMHEFHAPLRHWIEIGPGQRPFVRIRSAKRASTGEPVALSAIPMQYHNCRRARELQREGLLPMPWGPPPAHEPAVPQPPPHLRHLIRDCDHD